MTETTDQKIANLESRIESLENRVSELESLVDENPSAAADTPHDRYDDPVLAEIKKNGDPGPRGTVKLYKQLTPITQDSTATKRAKQLRSSRRFKQVVQQ